MSYPPSWKFDLDEPKASADTPDDEFVGGTLDPKWTVVDGASGVCDLTYGGGGRYDLTSRDSWLLMQVVQGDLVSLRQDYTLPDGSSIVCKLAPNLMADAESGIAENELRFGFSINDNDAAHGSGAGIYLNIDANTNGWRLASFSSAGTRSTPSGSSLVSAPIARSLYFRFLRVGLIYYSMWSVDGTSWFMFASVTMAAAMTNVWITTESSATFGDPTPIQAVDYVRLGGSGIDPW